MEHEHEYEEVYYAYPIDNIDFSVSDLNRMGICFINALNEIDSGLNQLGVHNVGPDSELVDYGYTLAQVGPLRDSIWVIYSTDIRFEYVSDILNKKNFYVILKKYKDGERVLFDKAHLREDTFEDDLIEHIRIYSESVTEPYPIFSDILQ